MTDRELMQQALEALQSSVPTQDGFLNHCKAMNHIRIRLTQPEPEPIKESSVTHSHLWIADLYGKGKNP